MGTTGHGRAAGSLRQPRGCRAGRIPAASPRGPGSGGAHSRAGRCCFVGCRRSPKRELLLRARRDCPAGAGRDGPGRPPAAPLPPLPSAGRPGPVPGPALTSPLRLGAVRAVASPLPVLQPHQPQRDHMWHVQLGGPHAGGDAAEHAAFFADAQLLQLHGGTWRRDPARPAPADPSRALLRAPRAANSAAPRGAAGSLPGGLLIYMRGGALASLPARPLLRSPPPAPPAPPRLRGADIGRGADGAALARGVGMEGRGSAPPRWAAIGARAPPPRLPAPSAGPFLLPRRVGRVRSALLLCPRCPSPPQSSPWPPPPQVTHAATAGCRWGGGRGEEGLEQESEPCCRVAVLRFGPPAEKFLFATPSSDCFSFPRPAGGDAAIRVPEERRRSRGSGSRKAPRLAAVAVGAPRRVPLSCASGLRCLENGEKVVKWALAVPSPLGSACSPGLRVEMALGLVGAEPLTRADVRDQNSSHLKRS